jgi:hypothetical protein
MSKFCAILGLVILALSYNTSNAANDNSDGFQPPKRWGRQELRRQATAFDAFGKGTVKAHYRFDEAKVDKAPNTIVFYYTELGVSRAATPYEAIMQPAGDDNCHILTSELSSGMRFKHIFRHAVSKRPNKVILIDPKYCNGK